MRRSPTHLPAITLAAALLAFSGTAQAQQALTPAPAASPSVIAPPAPLPEAAALAIPAPPGTRMRLEMDARSEDLLGLVKSFLKGIGDSKSADSVRANSGSPTGPMNPIEEALQNGNLADILKDVNRFHFAVWELPPPPGAPGKKTAAAPPAAPPNAVLPLDTNAFYESAYQAEGAHRILYTDADEYKLVMVGFPDHHGYAFAASDLPAAGGGFIAAARADAYPNMEAPTSFASHLTSAVLKTKTGKDMMDATLNGGRGTGTEDKGADKK